MSMFGKHCKECEKPARNMDYCDKHYDKDKMVEIFKRSCKKHLKKFDEQKKQHRKKNIFKEIFDEMYNVCTKIVKLRY